MMNNDQFIAIEGDIENVENLKNYEGIMKKERTVEASSKFVIVIATNQDD